jgi:hypothetical protein
MNSTEPPCQVSPPEPTAAEALQARFGDQWEIWREIRPGGSHGDWIARRWPTGGQPEDDREQLRALTVDALSALLSASGDERGDPRRMVAE